MALLARAARDGIQLPSGSPKAAALADDILRTVDSAPVRNTWTEVTACEAAIALGRYDEAVERGEAFIETTPEGFDGRGVPPPAPEGLAARHHHLAR